MHSTKFMNVLLTKMAAPWKTRIFCISKRVPHMRKQSRCMSQNRPKTIENHANDYWRPVIGLEIHAQMLSNSKLFSGAGTKFAAATNSQVSYFDAALPGTLPVINKRCVEAAVMTGLALNCQINLMSKFDRKHYFYADLPAGYQITQYRIPIAVNGHLDYAIFSKNSQVKPQQFRARIVQIQIEQDSGKSLHDSEERKSLIDLNRAGMGLMEIVTAPDFNSADEASSFVHELQQVLTTIGTCDGNMAEGSVRVDANISVHGPDDPIKGIRAEVKNINSLRFVRKAIDYEIARQIKIRESGSNIIKETRSFDFATGTTIAMRDKESLLDYRFMPEPNLPPLRLCDNSCPDHSRVNIDDVRGKLPILPAQMREDLELNYAIPLDIANELVLGCFYDCSREVISKTGLAASTAVTSILTQLVYWLKEDRKSITDCSITNDQLADLAMLRKDHKISKAITESVLRLVYNGDSKIPSQIIQDNDWSIINDKKFIAGVCQKIMNDNPKAVVKYRKGKKRVLNFFIGEVHKVTRRRAENELVEEVIQEVLN